jgi:hypothetical protein
LPCTWKNRKKCRVDEDSDSDDAVDEDGKPVDLVCQCRPSGTAYSKEDLAPSKRDTVVCKALKATTRAADLQDEEERLYVARVSRVDFGSAARARIDSLQAAEPNAEVFKFWIRMLRTASKPFTPAVAS